MSKSRYSSAHFLSIASNAPDWQGRGITNHERSTRSTERKREPSLGNAHPWRNQAIPIRSALRDSGISICGPEHGNSASRTRSMANASPQRSPAQDVPLHYSQYTITTRSNSYDIPQSNSIRITDDTLQSSPARPAKSKPELGVESLYHTIVKETSRQNTDSDALTHNGVSQTHQPIAAPKIPERASSVKNGLESVCKGSQKRTSLLADSGSRYQIPQEALKRISLPPTTLEPLSSNVSLNCDSADIAKDTHSMRRGQFKTELAGYPTTVAAELIDEYSFDLLPVHRLDPHVKQPTSDKCFSILSSASTCIVSDPARPIIPSRTSSINAISDDEFAEPTLSTFVATASAVLEPLAAKDTQAVSSSCTPSKEVHDSSSSWLLATSPSAESSSYSEPLPRTLATISRFSEKKEVPSSQAAECRTIIPTTTASSIQHHTRIKPSIDTTFTTFSHTRSVSNYSRPTTAPERTSSEMDNSFREPTHNSITNYPASFSLGYESTSNSASLPNTPSTMGTAIKTDHSKRKTSVHESSYLDTDLGLGLDLGLDFDFDFDFNSDLELAYSSHLYPPGTKIPRSKAPRPNASANPNLIYDAEVCSLYSISSSTYDSDCASEIISQYTHQNNETRLHRMSTLSPTSHKQQSSSSNPNNGSEHKYDNNDATPPSIPISRSRPVARILHPAPWLVDGSDCSSPERLNPKSILKSSFRSKSLGRSFTSNSNNKNETTKPTTNKIRKKTDINITNKPSDKSSQAEQQQPPKPSNTDEATTTAPSYDWDWDYYNQRGLWKTKTKTRCHSKVNGVEDDNSQDQQQQSYQNHFQTIRDRNPSRSRSVGSSSGRKFRSGLRRVLRRGQQEI